MRPQIRPSPAPSHKYAPVVPPPVPPPLGLVLAARGGNSESEVQKSPTRHSPAVTSSCKAQKPRRRMARGPPGPAHDAARAPASSPFARGAGSGLLGLVARSAFVDAEGVSNDLLVDCASVLTKIGRRCACSRSSGPSASEIGSCSFMREDWMSSIVPI